MTAEGIARALAGRVVAAHLADPEMLELLFRDRPAVHEFDARVYSSTAVLPEVEPDIREVLPRVIVEVRESPFDTEQKSADIAAAFASCAVYVHTLAEESNEDLADAIAARSRTLLLSTGLSDASIIVAELVPGNFRAVREPAFRDAHRFTREYRTYAGVR